MLFYERQVRVGVKNRMFFNIGTDMGIDLGTATVLVYVKGKGVILKEPSVVAIDKNRSKVLAVGEEAWQDTR